MDLFHLPGWEVLRREEGEHVYRLTLKLSSPFPFCPSCGTLANRYGKRRQVYIDRPRHGKRVYLLVDKQRYRCTGCGRTFVEVLPEMDEARSVSQRLRAYLVEESFKRSFVSIADEVGIHEKTVRTIFREHLHQQGQELESDVIADLRKPKRAHAQRDETRKLCEQPKWYHLLADEQKVVSSSTESLLRKRYTLACQMADILSTHAAITSILVIGSVARGDVDERSPLDILVVCRPSVVAVAERKNLLMQIGPGWLFQDQSNENPIFADSDTNGNVEGVPVNVHYQTAQWLTKVLKEVLEDGVITTKLIPHRPYMLPSLLQSGWLLLDKRKILRTWCERMQRFPSPLKKNLLRYCIAQLHKSMEELVANAEHSLGPRLFLFHLNGAIDALISTLFVLNEVYEPSDRRAEQSLLSTLKWIPRNFFTTLTFVLEGPFDDHSALLRAHLFRQLAIEVLSLSEDKLSSE